MSARDSVPVTPAVKVLPEPTRRGEAEPAIRNVVFCCRDWGYSQGLRYRDYW